MENTRKFTRNLMAKFPSWMKMAKDPLSVGAKFLDVFGLSFQEFKEEMDDVVNNFYIETADMDMIDILYRIPITKDVVTDFDGNNAPFVFIKDVNGGIERVNQAKNIRTFYHRKAELPLAMVNRNDGYLYLRVNMDGIENRDNPFELIKIADANHYDIEYHHVWNVFDEFGFLLGLKRLPLEQNKEYKKRILDVFINPGSNTKQGIANGLARELGLSKEEVDVFNLDDKTYNKELVKANGSPTDKMRAYAKSINQNLKFTIDTLNLGEAYWHSIEQNNIGIYFLPHIWDIDKNIFETKEFQSGIGYDDDLKVNKPNLKEGTMRDFVMNVTLVGYYEKFEEFFPEISFQYKIYAEGKLLENSYEEEVFKYTTIAAEDFNQKYSLTASQDFLFLHELLFDDENEFKKTNDLDYIQFAESNDFLNNQEDDLLRLSLYLTTANEYESNQISDMNILWEDTAGKEHTFSFKTRNEWTNTQKNPAGQPTSTIVTSGTYYNTDDNSFELGRGNFNETISTSADFMRGSYDTNFVLIEKGEVKLNIENINQIMN